MDTELLSDTLVELADTMVALNLFRAEPGRWGGGPADRAGAGRRGHDRAAARA